MRPLHNKANLKLCVHQSRQRHHHAPKCVAGPTGPRWRVMPRRASTQRSWIGHFSPRGQCVRSRARRTTATTHQDCPPKAPSSKGGLRMNLSLSRLLLAPAVLSNGRLQWRLCRRTSLTNVSAVLMMRPPTANSMLQRRYSASDLDILAIPQILSYRRLLATGPLPSLQSLIRRRLRIQASRRAAFPPLVPIDCRQLPGRALAARNSNAGEHIPTPSVIRDR